MLHYIKAFVLHTIGFKMFALAASLVGLLLGVTGRAKPCKTSGQNSPYFVSARSTSQVDKHDMS